MQYFSESPMGKTFEQQGLPDCEERHGDHGVQKSSDDIIGIHESATCVKCHKTNDAGYQIAYL
jgi:hypothetical protein